MVSKRKRQAVVPDWLERMNASCATSCQRVVEPTDPLQIAANQADCEWALNQRGIRPEEPEIQKDGVPDEEKTPEEEEQ